MTVPSLTLTSHRLERKMSARQPPTVLSSAARKRRERERAEKRKSELQALLKWHMDRMPAEAPRDRASVSGEARESKRKSIDPMVSSTRRFPTPFCLHPFVKFQRSHALLSPLATTIPGTP